MTRLQGRLLAVCVCVAGTSRWARLHAPPFEFYGNVCAGFAEAQFRRRLQNTPDPCDASMLPVNGDVGTCTNFLPAQTTCQPTCHPGYMASGPSFCDALGRLIPAVCLGECRPRNLPLVTCAKDSNAADTTLSLQMRSETHLKASQPRQPT